MKPPLGTRRRSRHADARGKVVFGSFLRALVAVSLAGAVTACDSGGSSGTGGNGGVSAAGTSANGGGAGTSTGVGGAGTSGTTTGTGGSAAGAGTAGATGVAGTGTGGSAAGAGTAGAAGSSAGTTGTTGAGAIKTLFLILEENKGWSEVKGSASAPYINDTLLPQAAYAEHYLGALQGNLHPSEPNYIWLEAGDNLGITNDDDPAANHKNVTDHLVTLLEDANISWKSYQEDIVGDVCPLTSVGEYKPKHNPMVFFDDVTDTNDPKAPRCLEHVRPMTELETDLASGKVGRYNFVTPNQCNDMHSACAPQNDTVKQGDDWLAEWIPKIQASDAYKDGGVIIITWDESELALNCILSCPIGMIVLSPLGKGGGFTSSTPYDHSSMLKTMQEIFGVTPLLRHAADSGIEDLAEFFATFP